MTRLTLVVATILLAAACTSENKEPTQIIGPPDTTITPPPPTPRIVLYAVPQGQPEATVNVSFDAVSAPDTGITTAPWNSDSTVYLINRDGVDTLNLLAHVADFNSPDSAGVPGVIVTWKVDSDAYSQDPKGPPGSWGYILYGLLTPTTVTDSAGNTTNPFRFDEEILRDQDNGYYHIEAFLTDTSGVVRRTANFWVLWVPSM